MAQNSNVERFESLLMQVKRDGMDNLLKFIRNSDFYTAPASTRFHGAYEGGLLAHSLNVYDCLDTKRKTNPYWKGALKDIPDDTIILVSLLHDLCKTYHYGVELKNKKIYSETGSKKDANGRYDWETVPAYVTDNKYPLGHGEKSVFFIVQCIKLNIMEIAAINHHMGAYSDSMKWNDLGAAYDKWPLCLALHQADMEATHLLEVESNG